MLITPGKVDQPLYARLWGSGFLPSRHQGVQFRSGRDPVLYLDESRRRLAARAAARMLDRLAELHELTPRSAWATRRSTPRIAQYEMAYPHADQRART